MAKKLLGERQVGDKIYDAGSIFTAEEAQETGLPATDFVDVADTGEPVEETPAAPVAPATDKDAAIDASAPSAPAAPAPQDAPVEQKNDEQSPVPTPPVDPAGGGNEGGTVPASAPAQ